MNRGWISKWVKMAGLSFAALLLVGAWSWKPQPLLAADPERKPLIIGHRGAAGLAPENTLAAFRTALDLGVDGLELDVQLTADNELVVHHDFALKPEIARSPNGEWVRESSAPLVKSLTLAEIKTYDVGRLKPNTLYAGRHPQQKAADGERIPTLREVFALLKSRSDTVTSLLIEIKTTPEKPEQSSDPKVVAEALIKLLREEEALSRALVLSFDWRSLVHVQKLAPGLPTVYLSLVSNSLDNIKPGRPGPSPWTAGIDVDDHQGSIPRAVQAAGGRYWGPHYKSVTRELVEEAQLLGIKVFSWTPDREDEMSRLMKMGVEGIITNRPDVLRSLLDRP